ncbi:hypothetical protein AVEN_136036-1 [Araneus ventricosus]|uniref:Chondroitin proteoglycan 4 domain-containing protein n=1 Tax=Araneus ventricosus TaxID=182803 RepID=A0A4Y2EWA2_ARAVE|nr:hypothetical protein AVEN_136036-1 [Araneus ventricosus]
MTDRIQPVPVFITPFGLTGHKCCGNTVTKRYGVGVVFMLILIHWGCCKNINCDANHCKSLFSTVFKDFFKKGTQLLCRSSDDTIECVDTCLQTFFPDFDFVNSKTSIASEVCSYDFQYDLNQHWNCISGHFHRLLTCMSKFGSMTPTDIASETLKLLSCKKFLEALNCPYEILHDCEEKAIEIVSKLFSKVFKASMDLACYTISSNDAYDLPVAYNLNNNYFSTSACLDKLPEVAGTCFTEYLKDFDANEIYHCRDTCETLDAETCLPSSLMNDFYIPVLSFGKHSCKEDSAVEDKVQMQEPSKASTVSYNSDMVSDYSTDSTANPADKNDYLVPSDEAKRSDVLSFDSTGVETSTLNYKLNTKEMEHDKVLSAIHSSINFPQHTSVASSEVHPEINSVSADYAADNATENNEACRLKLKAILEQKVKGILWSAWCCCCEPYEIIRFILILQ